jgi:mannose-6-phosphate isomerase-like protein (cupin superfamily)
MAGSGDSAGGGSPPLDPARIDSLSLADKFALIDDYWHPRIIAELNDSYIKIAKLKGEFVWHSHSDGDELFLVVKGTLTMRMRGGGDDAGEGSEVIERTVGPGELIVVPRGVEHMPVAAEEVHVMLIEPKTMLNTGDVRNERTVDDPEWV